MLKPVKTFTNQLRAARRPPTTAASRADRSGKTIRDAVHGDMVFSSDEIRLLDTRAMQRLRGVKQLGLSNLVYPSAVHTRFEHSLGACHLAGKIIESLEQKGVHRFSQDDRRHVRAAALLHDITHVPFGHTFEDERRIAPRHDADPSRLENALADGVGDELKRQGLLPAIRPYLTGGILATTEDQFLRDIFAGTICADLLDYLRRDAAFCGLTIDYDNRIFSLFTRLGGRLALDLQRHGLFRHDALSEVVQVLRMRYLLTERVYFHHAKVAAGAMLSKALELAIAAGHFRYADLIQLRDDAFLHVLQERVESLPDVRQLLTSLATRQLYKPVFLCTRDGLDDDYLEGLRRQFHENADGARTRLEDELCTAVGVPNGSIIVYCPSPDMALKEANVTVQLSENHSAQLASLHHPEIETLLLRHRQLWRLVVLAGPHFGRHDTKIRRALAHLCEERLNLPNQIARARSLQKALIFPA
ncbi:MAG: HD domain-containing protein [Chloracidobacterium sp.]